jgi:hypothetical protein
VQPQHWDKGEGQCRECRRHQDKRVKMAVEQVLIEERTELSDSVPEKLVIDINAAKVNPSARCGQ